MEVMPCSTALDARVDEFTVLDRPMVKPFQDLHMARFFFIFFFAKHYLKKKGGRFADVARQSEKLMLCARLLHVVGMESVLHCGSPS